MFKRQITDLLINTVYYWCEHSGLEVDFLLETNNQLHAIEAKSGKTLN